MPSVLAEISFLTNPQEAKLLKGSGYRQRIAQALFEGIKEYQTSLKNASSNRAAAELIAIAIANRQSEFPISDSRLAILSVLCRPGGLTGLLL